MKSKQEILEGMPEKQYYRIGEVERLTGIRAYVLRFWESEFPSIAPQKSRSGQRMYRRKDIETVLEIKDLLYEQKFTIKGARRRLAGLARGEAPAPVEPEWLADLRRIKTALEEIRAEL
jgi:DNA-binding transcriptional MerR regulator